MTYIHQMTHSVRTNRYNPIIKNEKDRYQKGIHYSTYVMHSRVIRIELSLTVIYMLHITLCINIKIISDQKVFFLSRISLS